MTLHEWEVVTAQLNLMDSHDTARTLWTVGGDNSALRLSTLFQMTMPGAPCIYYGDEIGLSAGDDPLCREAFPWHDEASWDMELLDHFRRATALRHSYPALRTGSFATIYSKDAVYAFRRQLDDEEAVVIFNTADSPTQLTLELPHDAAVSYTVAWPKEDGQLLENSNGMLHISVPAREGVVLVG